MIRTFTIAALVAAPLVAAPLAAAADSTEIPTVEATVDVRTTATATPSLAAARRTGAIACDGRLDEAAWSRVPVFDRFVQSTPRAGHPATQRTEVRIAYDDRAIFVGVTAFDTEPALIGANLGRRDAPPASDQITVAFDTRRDRRNAYAFTVNAAGVQRDGLYVDDGRYVTDWDGVWCGEVSRSAAGWTAELEIPLSLLRFSAADEQTWGVGVRREIARSHEVVDSAFVPETGDAMVSRFAELGGLRALRPRAAVALSPYVGARVMTVPELPADRIAPSLDVGVDAEAALGSSLHLTATVNPDYGQVEADEVVLNLSTFETFFPEKRPFFTRGMELFEPIEAEAPLLFYSRRIGQDAAILGAAKLMGSIGDVQIGVLDAIVTGPHRDADDADDTTPGFHIERPLHLGPAVELPVLPVVSKNFAAATVRAPIGDVVTVGGQAVSVAPLSGRCDPSELPADVDPAAAECLAPRGGDALAVNADARRGNWVALAQAHGSRITGGPDGGVVLRDGTLLRDGDLGAGGLVTVAKTGGEPWRVNAAYRVASPRLDLNEAGFLRTQNEQLASASAAYVRSDLGPWRSATSKLTANSRWTSDGHNTPLGVTLDWLNEVTWPSSVSVGVQLTGRMDRHDVREIAGTGIVFERPDYGQIAAFFNTDTSRALQVSGFAFGGYNAAPASSPSHWFGGVELETAWQPTARIETQLSGELRHDTDGPRFLEVADDGGLLFGDLRSNSLSVTLRQLVVVTRSLTVQGYAQLFAATGRVGPYYRADAPGRGETLEHAALVPTELDIDPSFHLASLNLSAVMRWEYRPGATVYAVVSRAQEEAPGAALADVDVGPGELFAGPSSTIAMVKWAMRWDL